MVEQQRVVWEVQKLIYNSYSKIKRNQCLKSVFISDIDIQFLAGKEP